MDDVAPAWFQAFETRLGERLNGLDARIGGLDTQIGGLDARIGALDTRIGALDARIDGLDARIGGLATRDELNRMRTEIMERIDRLQELVTQQQDESAVNYAAAGAVRKQIQGLEDQVAHLTRIMFRLRSRLDDLEGRQRDH